MSEQGSNSEIPIQIKRLVDWNTDILHRLLKQVVAKRQTSGNRTWEDEPALPKEEDQLVLDEVTDVIDLPGFSFKSPQDPDMVDLPPEAAEQLHAFVAAVANAYHSNPFHCLQHASAVTMHLSKLLSRIVVKELHGIDEEDEDISDSSSNEDTEVSDTMASHLHNHTFGITSDPLTQFSLVLSAFIHAVDHMGIPNLELAKEDPESAISYRNNSIIEQRSINKAWKKLMEPAFLDLRKCIYSDETELKRFRQVIVNSVLSTDIENQELQNLRVERWEKTFSQGAYSHITPEDVNRKATIVIEHLMQASDVFHTMQPWIVYEKWCSRDFEEKFVAFKKGRTNQDPAATWYQNEVEFFDNYVIPLAMQLKDCDAFVVSSDEYLNYALKNRQQLATKGQELVPKMILKLNASESVPHSHPTEPSVSAFSDVQSNTSPEDGDAKKTKHFQRLIDWNVEMLKRLLKHLVARRQALGEGFDTELTIFESSSSVGIIDEVSEAIEFPSFDPSVTPDKLASESIDLGVAVESQLRRFVTDVSSRFKKNDFHGLDHSSQVCMSTRKMLSRISTMQTTSSNDARSRAAEELHHQTYGISSDPLAQFAVVFAALIHDCDHQGVPNSQLVREDHPLASKYKNRSISEQHSIEITWDHFMESEFSDLRACVFSSQSEMKRFRQIVVNCILSTDFVDEDLVNFRSRRWQKAFVSGLNDDSLQNQNRRGTIVLEILIQTAEIFHADQNWHLYQRWNERHFSEVYKAFKTGRLIQDPSIFWYKSELLFFDDYAIPIAKQMSECGVFGTSGDEHLSFTLSNRQQWATKGGDNIASMMARYHGKEIEKSRTRRAYRRMSLSAQSA